MLSYLTRRLLAFIPVLWAVVTLVFLGLRLTPGDPSRAIFAEALITPEQLAANRAGLGLDRPLAEQYIAFLRDLLRGDLGRSLFTRQPVGAAILEQAAPTVQLALCALVAGMGLGLLWGVAAGFRPGRLTASAVSALSALSLSLPAAWTGLLALWLAARLLRLHATPVVSLALPALVLGFAVAGPIAGVTQTGLAAARNELHLLAARARGVAGPRLMWHALRAALVPAVNMLALQAAFLFGGTVVTETVFARPGLGRLLVASLLRKDFPVVQGMVLVVAALYLVFNLLADILAAALDPRLRPQAARP